MLYSLIQKLRDIPMAFIDVETNGISAAFGCRVIEIGVVRIEGGQFVSQYDQLIDPRRRISPQISMLTGITPGMCVGKPTFAQQVEALLPFLRGAMVVGHNVKFDLSFLTHELSRARVEIERELGKVPVLDTVRIARRRFGRGGNGLGKLSRRLGIVPDAEHRALPDAMTTWRIFQELIAPIGGWELTLADVFLHQGGPMHMEFPAELPEACAESVPVVL